MENTTASKPGGISIHAIDIANGVPAAGLQVRLWSLENSRTKIAEGLCNPSGLLDHPVSNGQDVYRGMFEVEFGVGEFYRSKNVILPEPAFLEVVLFQFGIDHVSEHYHLPFKFTPWGYSLFRGGS